MEYKAFELKRVEYNNDRRDVLIVLTSPEPIEGAAAKICSPESAANRIKHCGFICSVRRDEAVIARPTRSGGQPAWYKFDSEALRKWAATLDPFKNPHDLEVMMAVLGEAMSAAQSLADRYGIEYAMRVKAASTGQNVAELMVETILLLIDTLEEPLKLRLYSRLKVGKGFNFQEMQRLQELRDRFATTGATGDHDGGNGRNNSDEAKEGGEA